MRNTIFKLILMVFIPLILLLPYIAFAQSHSSRIILNIYNEVYSIGMEVDVEGQVLGSFNPINPVLLSINGPDGNTYHTKNVRLDDTGTFSYQFVIGDNASLGRNTLEVIHKNTQEKINGIISFEVKERASVTVETSKTAYKLGQNVVVHGTISPILPKGQVLIEIFNPKNNAWTFKSVPTSIISSEGQFSVEVGKLDGKLSLLGVYKINVTYAAATATATTSFSVDSDSVDSSSPNSQPKTKSYSQSITPVKVTVEEKENESKSTDIIAKESVIQSEIKNNELTEQEFTYIVLIKDSEGFTISLSWESGKLSASQTITMEQQWIPETRGIYTAEIFVWVSFENPLALSSVVLKNMIVE